MPKRLTRSQLDQFNELGFVSGVMLVEPVVCSNIRERIEALESERPEYEVWAFDI